MVDLTGVLTPKEGRDIETITNEVLELKKTAGESILGIGHRLLEAKSVLKHGDWLPWLSERVDLSERAAQNFMKLAREWSNPQALSDLGASKALALLAIPAEDREEFIAADHVVDSGEVKKVAEMTTRELDRAIKARDEAVAREKSAVATANEAVETADRFRRENNALLDSYKDADRRRIAAEQRAEALQRKLDQMDGQKPEPVEVVQVQPTPQPSPPEDSQGMLERFRDLEARAKSIQAEMKEIVSEARRMYLPIADEVDEAFEALFF